MQRERTNQTANDQRAPRATRYEIVECDDCGHDWVRPSAKRTFQLPCGKCQGRELIVRPLLAGGAPERIPVYA
jgi:hypothetical protein